MFRAEDMGTDLPFWNTVQRDALRFFLQLPWWLRVTPTLPVVAHRQFL